MTLLRYQSARRHSLQHFAECVSIAADTFCKVRRRHRALLQQRHQNAELSGSDVGLPRYTLVETVIFGFEQAQQKSNAVLELPLTCQGSSRTRSLVLLDRHRIAFPNCSRANKRLAAWPRFLNSSENRPPSGTASDGCQSDGNMIRIRIKWRQ